MGVAEPIRFRRVISSVPLSKWDPVSPSAHSVPSEGRARRKPLEVVADRSRLTLAPWEGRWDASSLAHKHPDSRKQTHLNGDWDCGSQYMLWMNGATCHPPAERVSREGAKEPSERSGRSFSSAGISGSGRERANEKGEIGSHECSVRESPQDRLG